jgi:hypothetical protein
VIGATSIGGRRSDFFTARKLAPGNLGLLQQYRRSKAPPVPPRRVCFLRCCGSVCAWCRTAAHDHSEPTAPSRERMRLPRFSRRIVSLQSVGKRWAPTASDIEGPTDLDWVGLCFETEISRCALDSCMAQERSNCLQIASAFQNVESLRPA